MNSPLSLLLIFKILLLFGTTLLLVESNESISNLTATPVSTVAVSKDQPSVQELIASKIQPVLAKHRLNGTSRLVDLKPAVATVTNLTQCYEVGIVGKDSELNIFNRTIEDSVYYYFLKLPNVINVQNAESRIGNLIHSILLITDEVIDCHRLNKQDPIGLTPLSCLPVDEQTSMLG